jgi:hypothetical protein
VPQNESPLRRARKRLVTLEENPTRSQLIFASGNWLSREAFQDLAEGTTHGGVFFKLFMRTAARLDEHRAGLLHPLMAPASRSAPTRISYRSIGAT